jgi:hypothetical protein
MESFSKRSQENFSHTTEQEHGVEDNIEPIALSYNDLLKLLNNYEQYGVLYHGTAHSAISRKVLPPFETEVGHGSTFRLSLPLEEKESAKS